MCGCNVSICATPCRVVVLVVVRITCIVHYYVAVSGLPLSDGAIGEAVSLLEGAEDDMSARRYPSALQTLLSIVLCVPNCTLALYKAAIVALALPGAAIPVLASSFVLVEHPVDPSVVLIPGCGRWCCDSANEAATPRRVRACGCAGISLWYYTLTFARCPFAGRCTSCGVHVRWRHPKTSRSYATWTHCCSYLPACAFRQSPWM